jgi:cleavage stimulation factor subunit 3
VKKCSKTASQLLAELNDYVSPTSGKRVEQVRTYFESLVQVFPLSGRFWKLYIEHEMKQRDYEKVEKLFQRCLIRVRHIELWRCYLHYVRETKGGLASFREKMGQAYEFALDKVGIDFLSHPIWAEYVQFLKGVEAVGSYAENQKITAVRRVYQRGVVNPMLNIEQFWKEYVNYEQSINPVIAEKMISDRSRDYMAARRVAKEYEAHTKGLNRNAPALPPTGRSDERRQVELWQRYVQWETSNPLRLEEPMQVIRRVVFAYEQCLLCMATHLDFWLEYAAYLDGRSRAVAERGDLAAARQLQDDTAALFERAIAGSMAASPLLHFAYADFEEARNRKDKAGEVYRRLLADSQIVDVTLAYIQYMRFARRCEGIKAARLVFKKAREDVRSTHHVYTFAALIEFYCSKDRNVACKIFELGLKKYASEPSYVLAYIDFFSQLNDENNTRVLFERVLSGAHLSDSDALAVWDRFLQFESDVGDLQSIQKVEKRRAQVLERLSPQRRPRLALQATQRYRFSDLLPFNEAEIRAFRSLPGSNRYLNSIAPEAAADTEVRVSKEKESESEKQTPENPMFKPDIAQMLPFKPIRSSAMQSHPIPGGVFPPPPAVGHLLSLLPHPLCFSGPFVQVDELLSVFRQLQLPDTYQRSASPHHSVANGYGASSHSVRQFDTVLRSSKAFTSDSMDSRTESPSLMVTDGDAKSRKRSTALNDDDEDDFDDDNSNSNPTHFDIYRRRQLLKRVK